MSTQPICEEPTEPVFAFERLGDYQLIRKIAEGGMSSVYLGRKVGRDEYAAIKVLNKEKVAAEFQPEARFLLEAEAITKLDHPNIVSIYQQGKTEDGDPWFAMEYVDGHSLYDYIKSQNLTTEHLFSWVPQICEALEFAHDNGIVHRDIKPANVLISKEGQVKVVDFGLAKQIDASITREMLVTQPGCNYGTPFFSPPEHACDNSQADQRSDIYSLSVLIYNFITGYLPNGKWSNPSQIVPGLPMEFDELVCKGLETNPDDRWQTVRELRKAFLEVPEKAARRQREAKLVKTPRRVFTGVTLKDQDAAEAPQKTPREPRPAKNAASGKKALAMASALIFFLGCGAGLFFRDFDFLSLIPSNPALELKVSEPPSRENHRAEPINPYFAWYLDVLRQMEIHGAASFGHDQNANSDITPIDL